MPLVKHDCATPVEDLKMLYARDYINLVSSGGEGSDQSAGPFPTSPYSAWPPGPEPTPESWADKHGTTWTRKKMDGKWVYQSSSDPRFYLTVSGLYEMMGLPKDNAGFVNEANLPKPWYENLNKGWLIAGAVGLFFLTRRKR